jgi:hypothetical protein
MFATALRLWFDSASKRNDYEDYILGYRRPEPKAFDIAT